MMAPRQTNLYTWFVDAGIQHFESEALTPTTNEQLLRQLQAECSGVDFTVRDSSTPETTPQAVVDELQAHRDDFDGVLIFGGLNDYRPVLTGLPTIAVYNFPGFSHLPYKLLQERGAVLTATCDRGNVCEPARSASMFRDLVEKIGLVDALARTNKATLLVIADNPYLDVHHGDRNTTYPGDLRQKPPEEFNGIFREAVSETLGTRLIKIGTPEVAANEGVQNADEQQASEIAKRWIAEAEDVRGTIKREVIDSARMYLAMKALMDEHGANAIATHIRSLTENPKPEDMIWPSLGNSQLQLEGIVGCCQAHINVVLTHMLAQYAFGRPSMMGDFMVDVANGVGIVMHCGAPWNPWGGTETIPYIIRDHAERHVNEHSKPGVGACSEVLFPPGEEATVWRIDVPTKSILVHTGRTVDGYALYKDWTNIMCRTKLAVELEDAGSVQSHLYPDAYGVHRTATLGDFREQVRHIGQLLGFEVVEEDRR
jgi:hypothetical protein